MKRRELAAELWSHLLRLHEAEREARRRWTEAEEARNDAMAEAGALASAQERGWLALRAIATDSATPQQDAAAFYVVNFARRFLQTGLPTTDEELDRLRHEAAADQAVRGFAVVAKDGAP